MKRLISIDPSTGDKTVVATFSLLDGTVMVAGDADALPDFGASSIVGPGGKVLRPKDGKAYYDALDRVRGSFYGVESDDGERPRKLRAILQHGKNNRSR